MVLENPGVLEYGTGISQLLERALQLIPTWGEDHGKGCSLMALFLCIDSH